jgi:hypothetical protein
MVMMIIIIITIIIIIIIMTTIIIITQYIYIPTESDSLKLTRKHMYFIP